jgi:hypothetical protein
VRDRRHGPHSPLIFGSPMPGERSPTIECDENDRVRRAVRRSTSSGGARPVYHCAAGYCEDLGPPPLDEVAFERALEVARCYAEGGLFRDRMILS